MEKEMRIYIVGSDDEDIASLFEPGEVITSGTITGLVRAVADYKTNRTHTQVDQRLEAREQVTKEDAKKISREVSDSYGTVPVYQVTVKNIGSIDPENNYHSEEK